MWTAIALAALVVLQAPEAPPAEAPPAAPTLETPSAVDAPTTPDPATEPPAVTPAPVVEAPVAAPPVAAPPVATNRLLVMDTVDKGAGDEITKSVNEAVQGQATRSYPGEVVIPDQIRASLDAAATQQLLGCDAEGCMSNIGRRIEASRVLGVSVAKVGDDLLLSVLVIDPRDASRIAYEQRKVAPHKDLYYYAARQLVALALTGRSVDPTVPVRVSVDGSVSDAVVIVDGRELGAPPLTLALDPGTHEIQVRASGYATWRTSVNVEEATPLDLSVALVEDRIALWPVSVTLGVVGALLVVGGAVAGIIALDMYAGSVWLGPEGIDPWTPANSYQHATPVSSADLKAMEQTIRLTSLTADVLYVGGAVVVGLAAVVLAADVVSMAFAE